MKEVTQEALGWHVWTEGADITLQMSQVYIPNGLHACRWTESLALFLKSLHSRFVRRLYIEHLPKNASTDVDMEDFEDDEEPDLGQVDIAVLDQPDMELDDEDMEGEHLFQVSLKGCHTF